MIVQPNNWSIPKVWEAFHLHMKTHSSDHMITTTTNTTAAVMMARCGMFNRRAHSFLSPLGFRLVFLYFLQIFCRVWSTVATSTDTSAICGCGEGRHSHSNAKCHHGSSKLYLPFQIVTPICVDSNRDVVNHAEMIWMPQTSASWYYRSLTTYISALRIQCWEKRALENDADSCWTS